MGLLADSLATVSSGLHTSAYFFGQTALHLIDILVQPAIFLSLYYTLTLPELSFTQHYTGVCCHLDMHTCHSDLLQNGSYIMSVHGCRCLLPTPLAVTDSYATSALHHLP